jgi:hypothetical protein
MGEGLCKVKEENFKSMRKMSYRHRLQQELEKQTRS